MPKMWTVSYTARRKRSTYERRTVTVQVTEEQYRRANGDELPDPGDSMELEQLAVDLEHGGHVPDANAGVWETYLEDVEDLDESDFETVEGGARDV